MINRNVITCKPLSFISDLITFIECYKVLSLVSNDIDHERELNAKLKPNIVLFVADDLGYNDLSLLGSPTIDTKNIDSIVNNHGGSIFSQFIVSGPICTV